MGDREEVLDIVRLKDRLVSLLKHMSSVTTVEKDGQILYAETQLVPFVPFTFVLSCLISKSAEWTPSVSLVLAPCENPPK